MAGIASAGVASVSHGGRGSGRTRVKEAPCLSQYWCQEVTYSWSQGAARHTSSRSSAFRTPAFRKIAKGTLFFEMPFSPSSSRYCLHPHLVVSVSVHNGIMTAAERAWRSLKDAQPSMCSKELLENEPRGSPTDESSFLITAPLSLLYSVHLASRFPLASGLKSPSTHVPTLFPWRLCSHTAKERCRPHPIMGSLVCIPFPSLQRLLFPAKSS